MSINKRVKGLIVKSLVALGFLLFFKLFLIDYYEVYSSSMLPTLLPGKIIVVDKLACGIQLRKNGHLPYVLKRHAKIQKDDILVFYKPALINSKSSLLITQSEYVKRCEGGPGDTITLNKAKLASAANPLFSDTAYNPNVYPHDSAFKWQLNQMGPLWIPKRGASIVLDIRSYILYKALIGFEGNTILNKGTSFLINGKQTSAYTFKYDYFFMLGDNFFESEDSRYWGMVPETNLIGRLIFQL